MRISWWAPFVLMGIIAALGLAAVWVTARHTMHAGNPGARLSLETLRTILANPQARWFLLFTLGICTAAQMPYLVYPLWFQRELHLTIEQLGYASIIVGVADLVAEVLTIFVVDRFGKRRSVIFAGVFYALAFGLFYALSSSVIGMMTALFCIYLGFEFTLVASLSIATELVPQARTAMMGFNSAASAAGRIIGSLIALSLFGTNRLWAVALASAVIITISILCSWFATAHKPAAVQAA
jgi:predicted MFS family arabinose efflux permease